MGPAFLFAVLSLGSLHLSFAPGANAAELPRSEVEVVAKDIEPCVQRMKSTYRFYHYVTEKKIKETLDEGMSFQEGVEKHLEFWTDYFWDPRSLTANAKKGLYVGTDPSSSRNWGGIKENFYLYRLEIPKGAGHIRLGAGCTFSKKSEATLQKFNCKADALDFIRQSFSNTSCKAFARQVFKRLGVVGYSYDFAGYFQPHEGCDNSHGGALVLFDVSDVPRTSVEIFDRALPSKGSPKRTEAAEITKLLREAKAEDIWPNLTSEEVSQVRSLDEIKASTLMGCEGLKVRREIMPCPPPPLGVEELNTQVKELLKPLH